MRIVHGFIWGFGALILLLVSLSICLTIIANSFFNGNVGWDPVALFGPRGIWIVVIGLPAVTFTAGFVYGLRRHTRLARNQPA